MSKSLLVILLVVLIGLAAVVVLACRHVGSRTPEALLAQLAKNPSDKEDLMMRINVARGDIITAMINAYSDITATASFRADVLELLFKRNFRSSDQAIEEVLVDALSEPDVVVRRRAVRALALYGTERLQVALADCVRDTDEEIRRQAYLVLGSRGGDVENRLWKEIPTEKKTTMIDACVERMKTETDSETRMLARAVVGREIEIRAEAAREAVQVTDLVRAEEILRSALDLDPENEQAQVRLVRFYLDNIDKEKALALAREYNALIEVPQLSEAPVIDGDPTEAAWGEAWSTDRFYHTTSRWVAKPTDGKSAAFIGHLDGRIYIAILGYEKDLDKLVVRNVPRDGEVWRDDCVELIFDPDITGKNHFQFVINPLGILFDQQDGKKSKNFECDYQAKIFKDRGYWAVEFSLDGSDLDNHPIVPGTIWSFVVFRVRIGAASEHGCIWPLFGGAHRMDIYPIAVFE